MYAKGVSKRDIQDILEEIYVIDISPDTIIIITEKVWQMVESWKNGPLALINAMVHLDALHIKLKRDAETASIAVSGSPGVDLNGNREILGHWISGL